MTVAMTVALFFVIKTLSRTDYRGHKSKTEVVATAQFPVEQFLWNTVSGRTQFPAEHSFCRTQFPA
jgi:hypothetical protein